ncbi:MAG: hypothetical protein JWR81_6356 [Pseudonocardia sp.]|jgi:hypothetical protein|nr:hypothetical protein [Pseudonocardia sp.]
MIMKSGWYGARVLRLLVDTSTWLDLARRRDAQKWIVALRLLVLSGDVELLVPDVLVAEYSETGPASNQR